MGHRRHTVSFPGCCVQISVSAHVRVQGLGVHNKHTHTHTHQNIQPQSSLLSLGFLSRGGLHKAARHLNLHHAVRRNEHIKSEVRNKNRLFLSSARVNVNCACSSHDKRKNNNTQTHDTPTQAKDALIRCMVKKYIYWNLCQCRKN